MRVYELLVLLALLDELERLLGGRLGAEWWVEELWWVLREECVEGREICVGV